MNGWRQTRYKIQHNHIFLYFDKAMERQLHNIKYRTILQAIYTETIKLCPLDVYVCQFRMYERI